MITKFQSDSITFVFRHLAHVGHDSVVVPWTRVILRLDALPEQDQGGVTLEKQEMGL